MLGSRFRSSVSHLSLIGPGLTGLIRPDHFFDPLRDWTGGWVGKVFVGQDVPTSFSSPVFSEFYLSYCPVWFLQSTSVRRHSWKIVSSLWRSRLREGRLYVGGRPSDQIRVVSRKTLWSVALCVLTTLGPHLLSVTYWAPTCCLLHESRSVRAPILTIPEC